MRLATPDDIPELVEMGRRFHAKVKPEWPLCDDALAETLRGLVSSGFVGVTKRGFIAGVLVENPISPGWLIGKEFLWWAEDGQGAKLRQGFRGWAREHGAREIQWSCPYGAERVRKVYARTAEPTEIIYSEYV